MPLNLNDLERITGGNMMVEPELPYIPGMEVMGVVDACGEGAEAWQGRRVAAITKGAHGGFAEYADLPGRSRPSRCPTHPASRRGRALLPVPSRVVGPVRPRRAAARRDRADPRRRRRIGLRRHPTGGARRRACVRHRRHRREGALCRELGADVAINYNTTDFAAVVLAQTGNRGVDVVFDNVGEAVLDRVDEVHGVQRSLPDDGVRVEQGGGRRDVHRAAPVAMGNIKLCGVVLAYATADMASW